MSFALKPAALVVLAATIQLAGAAYAQAPKATAAPVVQPAPAIQPPAAATSAPSIQPDGCWSWACLEGRRAGLIVNDFDVEQSHGSQSPHQ